MSGDGRVRLSWTAPASDGGHPIVAYDVYRSTTPHDEDADQICSAPPEKTSCTATGLRNGTKYYFDVVTDTDVGRGVGRRGVGATGARADAGGVGEVPGGGEGRHGEADRARRGRRGCGAVLRIAPARPGEGVVEGRLLVRPQADRDHELTVVSDGKTSKALKVSVVALTLRVVGRQPLAAGKHVLQGQAPRGMTVTLQQNGRTIAHTTATKHNAFAFTRALTTTHKYRIACDGVVSRTITVHVR